MTDLDILRIAADARAEGRHEDADAITAQIKVDFEHRRCPNFRPPRRWRGFMMRVARAQELAMSDAQRADPVYLVTDDLDLNTEVFRLPTVDEYTKLGERVAEALRRA